METIQLGATDLQVPAMGVGTMMWAGMPGAIKTEEEVFSTFCACLDEGLSFFDTAELYGNGASELVLGRCIKKTGAHVLVADKFAPVSSIVPKTPKRHIAKADTPAALKEALDDSLQRLGVETIDFYQMHAAPKDDNIEGYMDAMAEEVRAGKIRAVGVCNFSASQIVRARNALAVHGIPLASAMTGYNIVNRRAEKNGILDVCRKICITLIPFAPLAEGILTGKYRNGRHVPLQYAMTLLFAHWGITDMENRRKSIWSRLATRPPELNHNKMEVILEAMDKAAKEHQKTLAQVALNWLLTCEQTCVMPIPGMKNPHQVQSCAEALGWQLSPEERACIEEAEEKC